jgi:hypothetical protein
MRIFTIIAEAVSALFDCVAASPLPVTHNCDEYGEELSWMGGSDVGGFGLHSEGDI